ncbi:MAG: hypothetical protein LW817_05565 [Candidatus Caenarcaniphilales bacterium]|nr:hypothetical protein [Candidatus Caenarcaniphilales bacterium]
MLQLRAVEAVTTSGAGFDYVHPNKNLGVGIVNPQYKLTVNGTTFTKGFRMQTGATNGYVLTSNGSGAASWRSLTSLGGSSAAGSNTHFQFNDAGILGGNGALSFTKATKTLAIPADAPLDINSTALSIADSNIVFDGASTTFAQSNSGFAFDLNASGDFVVEDSRLVADSNGNIGINTNNPQARLDIRDGGGAIERGLQLTHSSNDISSGIFSMKKSRGTPGAPAIVANGDTISYLNFRPFNGDGYMWTAGLGARVRGTVTGTSIPSDLFFSTSGGGDDYNPFANNTVRMLIDSTGNIGLGTTIPNEKLTINGSAPIVSIREGSSPASTANFGKLFVSSTNSRLYFRDDAGVNYNLTNGSTTITPAGSNGSIQFKSGTNLAADASNLHWDDTNDRLGIGTNNPSRSKLRINTSAVAEQGLVLRGMVGQTGNLQEWKDNNGTSLTAVNPNGRLEFYSPSTRELIVFNNSYKLATDSSQVYIQNNAGTTRFTSLNAGGYPAVTSVGRYGFTGSSTAATNTVDTAIGRNAAGVIEINNGASSRLGGLLVGMPTASISALRAKAFSSPITNIQEWLNSTNGVLSLIDNGGRMAINRPTRRAGSVLDVNGTIFATGLIANGTNPIFSLREGSAPAATANFGKLFVNSTTSNLVFMDDAGASYDLLSSFSSSTNAGGSNSQFQFNDSGVLAGNGALTFTKATKTLSIPADAPLDINSTTVSIADSNIAFDSGSGVTFTPTAGQNLNVALSTTGDFAVNTNQLYVDTSATNTGFGMSAPNEKITIEGRASLLETTRPVFTTNYGKLYVNGTTSNLMYLDDAGVQYDITSSGGTPGGSTGAIQFNNSGVFGADTNNFYWDDTNDRMGIGTNAPARAKLRINTSAITEQGLVLRGIAGQTANLQEWQNNAGSALAGIRFNGNLFLGNNQTDQYSSPYGSGSGAWTTPYAGHYMFTSGQPGQYMRLSLVTGEGKIAGVTHYDVAHARGRLLAFDSDPAVGISFSPSGTELLRLNGYFATDATSSANWVITTPSASAKPLVLKAAASQTANLTEWHNSAGLTLSLVDNLGRMAINRTNRRAGSAIDVNGTIFATGLIANGTNPIFSLREGSAPAATANFGKLFVNSTTSNLVFMDDAGATFDLLAAFSSSTNAGGSNSQFQFNDSGVLAGNGALTFTKATKTLSIPADAPLDINSTTVSIADSNIAFDSGSGVTFTPTAGQNLNVALSTTGDFAVNTNHLYVDTSATNVGVGMTAPNEKITIEGRASLLETTRPMFTTNYGKLYVNGSTSNLMFLDDAGTQFDLLSGGGGSDANTLDTIDSTQFLRSDTSDQFTSGTLTTATGTTFKVNGDFALIESTAPSSAPGFGKLFVNSTTSNLVFMDDAGATFDLLSSFSSSTNAGGSNSQFQFNDSGVLAGNGALTFTKATKTLTVDTTAPLDINSTNVSIADTNITLDGASTTFTGTGFMTIQPGAGNNLNVTLSGAGDFAVNTNQLYVDTSATNVGVGTTTPAEKLQVAGTIQSTGLKMTTGAANNAILVSDATGLGAWTSPTAITLGNASNLDTLDSSQFLRSDTSDQFTSGTLTLNAGTTFDVDSTNVSIADTNIAFDGASTTFTGTGTMTITPGSGTNLNVSLATTGDFAVNTNQLYVDTSATNTGFGMTAPNEKITIEGNLSLREGAAPTATANYGKLFVNSTTSNLVFMDDAGASFDLLAGGGSSDANTLDTIDSSQFLRSDTSDQFTSGTLTLNTGTTFDVDSTNVSIADNNISFDSGTGVTFTPTAGQNLNIALSTTGDFAVNTNQLYVDTSTANVSVGKTSTTAKFEVNGSVAWTPSAIQSLSTGSTIAVTNSIINIAGNAGAVDLSSNPQIADGTHGQVIIIKGTSNTNTVTLDDGTGFSLNNGLNVVLGNRDTLTLMYDAGDDLWIEISRSNK